MNEKTVTVILLVAFATIFVYSAFLYDADVTGQAQRNAPVQLQPPTFGSGTFVGNQTNHTECINYQCVVRPGPGNNQCTTNAQCQNQTNTTTTKRVFVTNSLWTGNLGGYNGATTICRREAQASALTMNSQWVPWISVNGSGLSRPIHARDKIPDARYVLLNGTVVADNKADLLDGSLDNPIPINQFNQVVPSFPSLSRMAWTGTNWQGLSTGSDCHGWTSNTTYSVFGTRGGIDSVNQSWTDASLMNCPIAIRLYCFEK